MSQIAQATMLISENKKEQESRTGHGFLKHSVHQALPEQEIEEPMLIVTRRNHHWSESSKDKATNPLGANKLLLWSVDYMTCFTTSSHVFLIMFRMERQKEE